MNFDYTYITLFGCIIFEPMVIITNLIMCLVAIYFFRVLVKYPFSYSKQMAWFIIIMGISGCFGAAAHAIHYQLGFAFFQVIFYISNAMNLVSVYFCFRGSYSYYSLNKKEPNKILIKIVIGWIAVMLVYSLIRNSFLTIKIHAGIVLVYALAVHYLAYKKGSKGSGGVVLGIIISFLSIIVHSLKFSFSEWFNYKDIAHVIMIISLIIIGRGIKINSDTLAAKN